MREAQNHIVRRNLRSEYSRLRELAMQRLKTLSNSEYRDVDAIRAYFKYPFEKLKNLKDDRRFAYEFMKVVRFLDEDYTISSLKELRASDLKALEKLHSHGYTFITKKNYHDFAKFMELVKSRVNANVRYLSAVIMAMVEDNIKEDGSVNNKRLKRAFNAYVKKEEERAKKAREALKKLTPEEIELLKKDIGVLYDNS